MLQTGKSKRESKIKVIISSNITYITENCGAKIRTTFGPQPPERFTVPHESSFSSPHQIRTDRVCDFYHEMHNTDWLGRQQRRKRKRSSSYADLGVTVIWYLRFTMYVLFKLHLSQIIFIIIHLTKCSLSYSRRRYCFIAPSPNSWIISPDL